MNERNDAVAGRRKAVGAVIRALRGQRTQAELGEVLGRVTQATVATWEDGQVDLTCEQVRQIEIAVGVRPGTVGLACGYVEIEQAALLDNDFCGSMSEVLDSREISWLFFSRIEPAFAAVRAADLLGLGVRLWNEEVPSGPDETELRWLVEVWTEPSEGEVGDEDSDDDVTSPPGER